MDTIEFDEPRTGVCSCCGASQQILTRYVLRDGAPFAIYKAVLTTQHQPPRAEIIVGFGEWAEDTDPSERTAFTFELWTDPENINVSLVNEENSAWESGVLGNVVSRHRALQHPLVSEVYKLAECILSRDEAVKSYLA